MTEEEIKALAAALNNTVQSSGARPEDVKNLSIGDIPALRAFVEDAAASAIEKEREKAKEKLQGNPQPTKKTMDDNKFQEILQTALNAQSDKFAGQLEQMGMALQQTQQALHRSEVLRQSNVPKQMEKYVVGNTPEEIAQSAKQVREMYESMQKTARTKALQEYGVDPNLSAEDYKKSLYQPPAPEPQEVSIGGKSFDLNALNLPPEIVEVLAKAASTNPEAHGQQPAPAQLPGAEQQTQRAQPGYAYLSQMGLNTEQPVQQPATQAQTPQAPANFGTQLPPTTSARVDIGSVSIEDYANVQNNNIRADALKNAQADLLNMK